MPAGPAANDVPVIPFQISRELLQSLASPNGAATKLLQNARSEGLSAPSTFLRTAKVSQKDTPSILTDSGASGTAKSPVAVTARPESVRSAPSSAVLQVPSAAFQSMGKTTQGKTALEYESIQFELKKRLQEAE